MELRAENLGPISGERILGSIDGPGWYNFLADNAAGKSTLWGLLARMQDEKMLSSEVNIADGELRASLVMEPAVVTFSRSPSGEIHAPERSGIDQIPKIETMPSSIETLISGDSVKDPEARARRRIKALLTYAPVQATEARARELCETLIGRRFSDNQTWLGIAALWENLASTWKSTKARARVEPLRDALAIEAWLLAQSREGVLDDHDRLLDILNATANTGEHASRLQELQVASAKGRMEEAVVAAIRASGLPEDAAREAEIGLLSVWDHAEVSAVEEACRHEVTQLETRAASQRAEEERRARLREAHGDTEPDIQEMTNEVEAIESQVVDRNQKIETAKGELEELRIQYRLKEAEVTEKERNVALINDQLGMARVSLRTRETARTKWLEVEEILAQPIEGPNPAEIATAREHLVTASAESLLARSAASYQRLAAEHESEVQKLSTIEALSKDYRKAARDSWSHLGVLLTKSLDLPWLQVDGLKIYAGYVAGKLNSDAGLIRQAEIAAQQAAAAIDTSSSVSLPRFILERIRSVGTVDWRDLDDAERVSTAELHEACLTLMLTKRESSGGIILVPWQITAALDGHRLIEMDRRVREQGLIVISERPWRRGDPEGLLLERISEEE